MALPLGGLVVILPKNAPSTEIGERLAADRLSVTGCRSSDWAPVSTIADTSVWALGACFLPPLKFLCGLAKEIEMSMRGCARRRARLHSPFVNM